jgi:sulfur relay (sulfurtransferase) complex TusBCD TusD component (DsrE family)
MIKALFIVNDPQYGAEPSCHGLRLAITLVKNDPARIER